MFSVRKMVIFTIVLSLVSAQLDCHWIHGGSGQHVDCLPGFYIDGICGSGSRNDCKFAGNGNENLFKLSFLEKTFFLTKDLIF